MTNRPAPALQPASPQLRVICLCAAWCRTCEAYEATFDALAAQWGAQVQALWLDIEDHEDWLDGLDVISFPTLLIEQGEQLLFFGPVLPHASATDQLVGRALQNALPPALDADAQALARRLHQVYLAGVGANTAAAGAAPVAGRLSTLRQANTSTATPEGA